MMKKILFYIDTLGKGGLDKVVLDVANNIDFKKYDVTVMRRFPGGYYSDFLDKRIHKKANMPFVETCSETYNHIVRVLGDRLPRKLLHRIFIGNKYDVEIACGDGFAARIIGGSNNKKSKKILWEHMDVTLDESTATHFPPQKVRWFFDPFDKIVAVSKDCKEKFIEKYGYEDRIIYIYNPINVKEIQEKSLEFEPEEMREGFVNLLAIGRMMPQKAFLRLIDVFRKVGNEHCKLFIIGEGPEYDAIAKKIKDYELENRIILLGYKENPYPYIKKSDIFICSSIHESYCLVLAESIVLEKPIISTECAGPIELLDNGKYGLLVKNNEDALVEGLKYMIEHKEQREKYSLLCKERKSIFSVSQSIKEWEKIWNDK